MRLKWTLFSALALSIAGRYGAAEESGLVKIENGILSVTYDTDMETFALRRGDRCFATGERFNVGSGIEVRVIEVQDALGVGQAIEEKDASGETIELALYEGLPFVCVKTRMHNVLEKPLAINELEPVMLTLDLGAAPEDLKLLGCDGLHPATEEYTGYTFLTVARPETHAGVVCGWLTQRRGSGIVQAGPAEGQVQVVGETTYGGRLVVPPDQSVEGEVLAVGFFDDAHEGLEAYASAIAKANAIELPDVPCGYCTWYHAGASDEKRTAKLAAFCDEHLRDYGFDFIQIDDGWQVGPRDFTAHKPDGPYPSGMKAVADAITAHGFRAGLWSIPFGWNHAAPALADHPDWFVHREDGSIYSVEWAGDCLDMSHPDARAFLRETVARMTGEWGYRYLKIDGLWSGMAVKLLYPDPTYREDGLGDATFHDASKTNVEVYRDGLELVREAAGDDVFLLGCTVAQNMRTLGASIGLVDGMRIGRDIGANWDHILPSARIGAHLYFLHGTVWYNDPDCLMLRDPLTLDQARAWASWICVSGQMNVVSEWLPSLAPEKLDIVKRTMPNHKCRARPVDLFEREFPRIWHLPIDQAGLHWDIVALFNWDTDREAKLDLELAALGLDDHPYVGFDYWENAFLAPFSGTQTFTLRPASCRVIALHRQLDRPQLIGTSRHVTQGAVDLVSVTWDAAANTLRGVSNVVAKDPYELRLITPWKSAATAARTEKADALIEVEHGVPQMRVLITSKKNREVKWEIPFNPG